MTLRGALVVLCALSGVAAAQRPGAAAGGGSQQREQLEARFRQQFARVVQQRVGLTNDQMARLRPINQRHAEQRRALQLQERSARIALQQALRNPDAADSAEVSRLLGQLVETQKRRAALLETEQRELATIMTPLQRARFMALQEQLRRQVEQRRGGGQGPARRRTPPR
jgi:Spy/CpxP family protein refolding chaperone